MAPREVVEVRTPGRGRGASKLDPARQTMDWNYLSNLEGRAPCRRTRADGCEAHPLRLVGDGAGAARPARVASRLDAASRWFNGVGGA